jgi:transcription elongation GreA/GreB family factor
MAVSRTIQRYIAKGDFDALEDDWLEHLAGDPDDLDYFAGVARALAGNGEEGRARLLLELADDQLRERGRLATRLGLLERAGALLFAPERLHPEIVATLRGLYAESPSFEGLAEKVGIHRAAHDLAKTWEKVARLAELLRFEVGAVVRMEGHGAGRVVEVNYALDSFKIDFERHPGLHVGFRAAPKMLEPLAPGHVLRRKLEEPAALAALAREAPAELLRLVLESYGKPLTAGEIRDKLGGVVAESEWTSFWAAARKHPHVVASQGGRQTYAWAESSDHAVEASWQAFAAADPRAQIALLRRDGDRDPDLARRMTAALAAAGAAAAAADPGLAFEIWSALDRRGDAGAAAPELPFAPGRLIAGGGNLGRLLAGIQDRALRERAYGLVRELRPDWPEIFLDRLAAEEDPRSLDLLAGAVAAERAPAFERFVDGVLAQPHRAPAAFAWLAERAAEDAGLRARNPLRLLQQILGAPARPELAPHRARLRRLAQSGGTLPRLLPHLAEEQAAAAREAVHRAPGLENWEREALTTALELRFPALRPEAAGEALYATREAIDAKRAELDRLTKIELPANRKAIQEARAHGDLSENFEYKAARQRHEYLSSLATMLQRDLARVRPLDLARVDPSEVRVGTRVRLRTAGGEERTLAVLGPWESAPERGVVSYQSELAKGLLGKRPGEAADLGGEAATVVAVERAEG